MILTEGQTGAIQGGEDIIYPEINTCMTVTIIYKDPFYIVGGHFSLPVENMEYPTPDEVARDMKTKAGMLGKMDKTFLIGARSVWNSNQMKPVYDLIKPIIDDVGELEEFDTFSWRSVNIKFKSNYDIEITPTESGIRGTGNPPASWK